MEFQFADDSGVFSSTRRGAVSRIRSYQKVGSRGVSNPDR